MVGDAIENMANAVLEAYGKAITSLGTMWVNIGTPNLTGDGGSSAIGAGSAPPLAENVTTVLGYVTWVALAVVGVSVVILGMMIAAKMRQGEGVAAIGRLGLILGGVILIAGASALVSALIPGGPTGASGAVLFLQSAIWWLVGGLAVLSVIVGGVRMAWEQRAEPGRQALKSLLTLIVVAGAGVTVTGLLVTAADAFSVWVINGSLECDVAGDGACFGSNMIALIGLTTAPGAGGLGALLIIILGLVAILAAAFQIVLMVARGAMLVILTGILPLSASFTNTEIGASWFKKNVGWLLAFILYKPAAAIVYAAAFNLLGTDVFSDDGTGLISILTGLMLMLIALFALPALMRFVTPLVGSMAGGTGGALGIAAIAALPTGAAALGRLGTGSSPSSSGSPPAGGGSLGSPSGSGGDASAVRSAPAPVPASTGAAASGGGAAAASSGAAAGGAAAAGGGAAGGAAAGAAGGPVGMAAGVAIGVAADGAKKAGSAVAQTAQSVGEQSTEGGPSGGQ